MHKCQFLPSVLHFMSSNALHLSLLLKHTHTHTHTHTLTHTHTHTQSQTEIESEKEIEIERAEAEGWFIFRSLPLMGGCRWTTHHLTLQTCRTQEEENQQTKQSMRLP